MFYTQQKKCSKVTSIPNANNFSYPAAKDALQYTSMSDFDTHNKSMGEVGFNSAGVGMSATETIYNGAKALKS